MRALNTHQMTTERLDLDLPRPEDAEELYRLSGAEDRLPVTATLLWDGPDDISDTREWIDGCRTKSYEEWGFHWVLRDRTGATSGVAGRPMGAIGLMPTRQGHCTDLGYWLGVPYWGRGLMTEAVSEVRDLAFDTLGFEKIIAEVFVGNTASSSILRKAGFTREGTVRSAIRKRGVLTDEELWGILRSDLDR